jgi:hypothetical protein
MTFPRLTRPLAALAILMGCDSRPEPAPDLDVTLGATPILPESSARVSCDGAEHPLCLAPTDDVSWSGMGPGILGVSIGDPEGPRLLVFAFYPEGRSIESRAESEYAIYYVADSDDPGLDGFVDGVPIDGSLRVTSVIPEACGGVFVGEATVVVDGVELRVAWNALTSGC